MTGILFALGALFAWGFGDFFIQRSVRAVGIWKSLLLIDAVGIVALFPFIAGELGALFSNSFHLGVLILASIIILLTALAVLLGVFANKERLRWHQIVGIVVTIASVMFLSAISSQK